MRRWVSRTALLLLLVAACGGGADGGATTSAASPTTVTTSTTVTTTTGATATTATATTTTGATTTTTAPPAAEPFAIYAFAPSPTEPDGPFLVPVARSQEGEEPVTVEVALEALVAGLDATEIGMGLSTAVPEGSRLLGTELVDGVVTVDLGADFESGGGSFSMGGRLGQVVYTATAFPEVEAVSFALEGEPVDVFGGEGIILDGPVDREDFADSRNAVFVDSPAWGAEVAMPLTVRGLARVFEGTVSWSLVDWDGLILEEGFATATTGGPEWGSFEFVIDTEVSGVLADPSRPFDGALIVWEESAEDGSQANLTEYPLRFAAIR